MSSSTSGARFEHTPAHGETVLTLDLDRVLDADVRHTVRAEFTYRASCPLLVTLVLLVEGGPSVTWCIGRDVLRQGMSAASGLGDIQVWPAHLEGRRAAWLRLSSRGAEALFELPVVRLTRWLDDTYRLVPAGTEMEGLDWETVTADLLRDPEVPSS